ncbi:MAG: hypothetical protein QXE01_03945 [Sulfolobales archaeon]
MQGFFGVGKTRSVLEAVSMKPGPVVIVSEPLRVLRDDVASRYRSLSGRQPPVLRAHDEVCQDLAQMISSGLGYFEALSKHLASGRCIYPDHVRAVASSAYSEGILVTTHRLSTIAKIVVDAVVGSPSYLVVDEAEDFVLKALEPRDPAEIEPLRMDPTVWRRITRIYEKIGGKYYLKPGYVMTSMRYMLLSATIPGTLRIVFEQVAGYDDIDRIVPPSRDDIFIFHRDVISSSDIETSPHKVVRVVSGICRPAVDGGGLCAVISKNKRSTSLIADGLRRLGIPAISDQDQVVRIPSGYSGAVIITVGGRFYRGVSLPEADVVVSLFQRHYQDPEHPVLSAISANSLDWRYAYELSMAANLQASYRCNRSGGKRHVMVFLDTRYREAFSSFYADEMRSNRIYTELIEVDSVEDAVKTVEKIF